MKRRNSLILLLIILLIMISTMSYIFILGDNSNKINNISDSNSTDLKLNKSNDKNNMSLNNTDNNSSVDENLSNSGYNPSSDNNQGKDYDEDYDEAMEAKLTIEKKVLDKNEIAGYPVYKDPSLDSWLVPIFDKNTKKFVSSVYVYVGPGESRCYVLGPQFYSEYKKVISGKSPSQSEINKRNRELGLKDIIEDSDSSDFYLLPRFEF